MIRVNVAMLLAEETKGYQSAITSSPAFDGTDAANGNRRKATWLYPKTRRQPNSNDCGYYLMRNMLDVVSGHITGNWMEVFNDPKELSEDELYDLRELWATCLMMMTSIKSGGIETVRRSMSPSLTSASRTNS
ncbi:hypothetical protein P8452_65622 [Trifolium repens]|nr:hypothetical protein P8452_65622 [Trifolium repens]